ncbi:MAG: SDR family NAD(P)-dependent oxidoreductase [Hyphomicrobiaceae bacterium]|nr:SDR family NAD(P)-dependent oxidoreductase [Hyphomicrobiaceae bacterium]
MTSRVGEVRRERRAGKGVLGGAMGEGAAKRWLWQTARASPEALAAIAGRRPAVVVAGGSRGIGRAIAERFAAAGHRIVLIGRDQQALADTAEAIGGHGGGGVTCFALDLVAPDAAARVAAHLMVEGLYLDILVLNAGIGLAGAFADADRSDLEALVALNVTATTRLLNAFLPELLARAGGGILVVSSLGAYFPGPYQAAYYASKAYQVALVTGIAHEVASRGVRLAVVAPGPVDTGFHAAMGAECALYRRVWPAMTPRAVAAAAYRGYRLGHRVIVPGAFNGLAASIAGLVPQRLAARIVATLLWPGGNGGGKARDAEN